MPDPIVVEPAKIIGSYEHTVISIVNAPDNTIYVECHWAGYRVDAGVKTKVEAYGPHVIRNNETEPGILKGADPNRLDAVALDAFMIAKAYEAAGVPAQYCFQGGLRDAIYHELQRTGKMPTP